MNIVRKVRIAVAGAGLIGLRHIEEVERCPATELSAIVDPGMVFADPIALRDDRHPKMRLAFGDSGP